MEKGTPYPKTGEAMPVGAHNEGAAGMPVARDIMLKNYSATTRKLITLRFSADLSAMLVISVAALLSIFLPVVRVSIIRPVCVLAFIFFVPGYSFVAAVLPSRSDLAYATRVLLAVTLSIIIVPLIGFVLNFTPIGISLIPYLAVQTVLTIILIIIAVIRRARLPENELPLTELREPLATHTTRGFSQAANKKRFIGVKRQPKTQIIGIVHQDGDHAELGFLSGSKIAGITYYESESNELKLARTSSADIGLLRHTIAAGVLYRDANTADLQLLASSKIVGIAYQERSSGLKLLPVATTGLQLLSQEKVRGVLYQEPDGADVKLLSETMDLTVAIGARLLGVLHQDGSAGSLQLLSREKVRGVLYQEPDGADVKLLSETMDLTVAIGATVLGILCQNDASSEHTCRAIHKLDEMSDFTRTIADDSIVPCGGLMQ